MSFNPEEYGQSDNGQFDMQQVYASVAQGRQVTQQSAQQHQQRSMRPSPQPNNTMRDVIRNRSRMASFYEALLEQNLFDNDDDAAIKVEQEVRQFVENRLAELLGIETKTNKPAQRFTDAEFAALKTLAEKLLAMQAQTKPPQVVAAPAPTPVVDQEPVVIPSRGPVQTAPVASPELSNAPTEPRVMRAPKLKGRKKQAPATEAAAKQSVQEPVYREPPTLPIAMPRGSAMSAVMATKAAEDYEGINQNGGVRCV